MKKTSEYYVHAQECRSMAAKSANEEQKAMLLQMANTWDNLARERRTLLDRRARIAAIEATDPKQH
jgi:hypothetical protein